MAEGPPLDGLRVVELGDARGELCARMLCDLGADVIKVEPPEGADSRREAPLHGGMSLAFAVRNAGKRSVTIDRPGGRDQLLALLAGADVWVQSSPPGWLRELGLTVDAVRARHPELVVISISDFGLTGPYRDWVASEPVLLAMGGVLSRSGLPGRAPLLPPGELARSLPAAQAAWAVLVAVWNRMATGRGDHIDFSLYEATAQVVEPAMGTLGTAQAAGYEPTRSRPAPGPYPIFRCRDGHVRVALLAPRQWQAMRGWLGDPEDLRDPELETIRGRALAAERLHAILEAALRRTRQVSAGARGTGPGCADRAGAESRRGSERRAFPRTAGDRAARAGAWPDRRGARRLRGDRWRARGGGRARAADRRAQRAAGDLGRRRGGLRASTSAAGGRTSRAQITDRSRGSASSTSA